MPPVTRRRSTRSGSSSSHGRRDATTATTTNKNKKTTKPKPKTPTPTLKPPTTKKKRSSNTRTTTNRYSTRHRPSPHIIAHSIVNDYHHASTSSSSSSNSSNSSNSSSGSDSESSNDDHDDDQPPPQEQQEQEENLKTSVSLSRTTRRSTRSSTTRNREDVDVRVIPTKRTTKRFKLSSTAAAATAAAVAAAVRPKRISKQESSIEPPPSQGGILEDWNTMFASLQHYKSQHGHCHVPSNYPQDPTLALWVQIQRHYEKLYQLSELQHEKLTNLGFQFQQSKTTTKTHHQAEGHDDDDDDDDNDDNDDDQEDSSTPKTRTQTRSKLQNQDHHQDPHKNHHDDSLSEQPQEEESSSSFSSWEDSFQRLLQYKSIHKNCHVPFKYVHDPQLGRWVDTQRYLQSHQELSHSQYMKLAAIGFSFKQPSKRQPEHPTPSDTNHVLKNNKTTNDESQHYESSSKSPPSLSIVSSNVLAAAAASASKLSSSSDQQQQQRTGIITMLPPARKPMVSLDSSAFDHQNEISTVSKTSPNTTINTNTNTTPPSSSTTASTMKHTPARKEQQQHTIELSTTVPLPSKVRIHHNPCQSQQPVIYPGWDHMYQRLVLYKKQYGDCRVSDRYKGDPKLGRWVKRQRERHKRGKMFRDEKTKLDEIGFTWQCKIHQYGPLPESTTTATGTTLSTTTTTTPTTSSIAETKYSTTTAATPSSSSWTMQQQQHMNAVVPNTTSTSTSTSTDQTPNHPSSITTTTKSLPSNQTSPQLAAAAAVPSVQPLPPKTTFTTTSNVPNSSTISTNTIKEQANKDITESATTSNYNTSITAMLNAKKCNNNYLQYPQYPTHTMIPEDVDDNDHNDDNDDDDDVPVEEDDESIEEIKVDDDDEEDDDDDTNNDGDVKVLGDDAEDDLKDTTTKQEQQDDKGDQVSAKRVEDMAVLQNGSLSMSSLSSWQKKQQKHHSISTTTPTSQSPLPPFFSLQPQLSDAERREQEIKNAEWDFMFDRLKAFKEEHGHCHVPKYAHTELFRWAHTQRETYSSTDILSVDQIVSLNLLGFSWKHNDGVGKGGDGTRKKPRRYRKRNALPVTPMEGTNNHNDTMNSSQTDYWDDDQQDSKSGYGSWDTMYERLLEYKRVHGNVLVPSNYDQDRKLAGWVTMQRFRHTRLTFEQKQKLMLLNFCWRVRDPVIYPGWDAMYDKLVLYKEQKGNCLVSDKYKGDPKLGRWVKRQRERRKTSKMTPIQFAKLNDLGFTWQIKSRPY